MKWRNRKAEARDTDRLSQEGASITVQPRPPPPFHLTDVERMVEEAERFKADDEAVAKRVGAKNEVENYAYSVRNATREDGVKDKLSEDELKTVNDAVEECINWLDANSLAEVE